jgi:hypothetical protein
MRNLNHTGVCGRAVDVNDREMGASNVAAPLSEPAPIRKAYAATAQLRWRECSEIRRVCQDHNTRATHRNDRVCQEHDALGGRQRTGIYLRTRVRSLT